MSISFSGLASGLDTSSWVESLVALKQAKVNTLQQEKENVVLSRDTLNSIKSFFASFRSTIEKITDSRFNIVSMDLFAQNLATSANLDVLTATATSEAVEGTYRVKVDKLASNTNAISNYRTIVQTTTVATADSYLRDIGVGTGTIGVTKDGIKYGISITNSDTIATFIDKLREIGVEADYNEITGRFNMNISASDIDDSISTTNIVDRLHLEGVNEGYKTVDKLQIETVTTEWDKATSGTLLSALGVHTGSATDILTINANGANYDITLEADDTIGDLVAALKANNIDADFLDEEGIFVLADATITSDGTTNFITEMGLTQEIYSKSQATKLLLHETVVVQTTVANSGTLIRDLAAGSAIQDGQNVIVKNSNNEYTTISVGTGTSIGDLLTAMSNAGLYAAINNDGTIEISGGSITGGSFNAISALGLQTEPYTAMTTGTPLTETVIEYDLVSLQTRLVEDLGVTKGYLEVTDSEGNKYYEKIYAGQTIADFMADMGNLGIYTKLDENTGVLEITGGAFRTLDNINDEVGSLIANGTIHETEAAYQQGTNLLQCLYGSDTISTEQITVASTYARTRALTQSVTNLVDATLSSTLGTLGLNGDGTAIFNARGETVTIDLTSGMTIQNLIDTLAANGIESSWDSDFARITINNATLEGGTSNLADVLNLTTEISGKYVTSDALSSQTTITIDASRDTLFSDLGVNSNEEVVLMKEDGTSTTFNVSGTTTMGNFIDTLNANGVTAKIENGVFSIDGGYITNTAIEEALGLEHAVMGYSNILGNQLTHTIITTATGSTTVGNIITALGTSSAVAGGYDIAFNSTSLSVSADTTIDELMSQIYALGGTSSIDSSGRLHIHGGTLSGTVATALGFQSITTTDSVASTGETLSVLTTVFADETTQLSALGYGESTISVMGSNGSTIGTITTSADMTIGEMFDELANLGVSATISNGIIRLASNDGRYATGGVLSSMGIGISDNVSTKTIGGSNTSTDIVSTTYTITADSSTTLGELGYGTSSVITVNGVDGITLGTITTNADMTIGDMLTAFAGYGISGTITDGVINLNSSNGSYVTGDLMTAMGIGASSTTHTTTAGLTATSNGALTYTKTTGSSNTSSEGVDYNATVGTGATSSTNIVATTTVGSSNTSSEGVDYNATVGTGATSSTNIVATTTVGSGNTSSDVVDYNATVGTGATSSTNIVATTTVGGANTSSEAVDYNATVGTGATSSTNIVATTTVGGANTSSDVVDYNATVGTSQTSTSNIEATTTVGGANTSSDVVDYNATVGTGATSSNTVIVSTSLLADSSTTLGELGYTVASEITVSGPDGVALGTVTTSASMTIGEMLSAFAGYGISGTIADGVIRLNSPSGNYVTGDVITGMGITTNSSNYTSTAGVANTSTENVTYTDVVSNVEMISTFTTVTTTAQLTLTEAVVGSETITVQHTITSQVTTTSPWNIVLDGTTFLASLSDLGIQTGDTLNFTVYDANGAAISNQSVSLDTALANGGSIKTVLSDNFDIRGNNINNTVYLDTRTDTGEYIVFNGETAEALGLVNYTVHTIEPDNTSPGGETEVVITIVSESTQPVMITVPVMGTVPVTQTFDYSDHYEITSLDEYTCRNCTFADLGYSASSIIFSRRNLLDGTSEEIDLVELCFNDHGIDITRDCTIAEAMDLIAQSLMNIGYDGFSYNFARGYLYIHQSKAVEGNGDWGVFTSDFKYFLGDNFDCQATAGSVTLQTGTTVTQTGTTVIQDSTTTLVTSTVTTTEHTTEVQTFTVSDTLTVVSERLATEDTYLMDILRHQDQHLRLPQEITITEVRDGTGQRRTYTVSIRETDTVGDFVAAINSIARGCASFNADTGIITIDSDARAGAHYIIDGALAEALGFQDITYTAQSIPASTTTVGATATSTAAITYTDEVNVGNNITTPHINSYNKIISETIIGSNSSGELFFSSQLDKTMTVCGASTVASRKVTVVHYGETHTITMQASDTLATLKDRLAEYDIMLNENFRGTQVGVVGSGYYYSITSDENCYISNIDSRITDDLKLYSSGTIGITDTCTTVSRKMTEASTLAELGAMGDKTMFVVKDGTTYYLTFRTSDTVGDIKNSLEELGIGTFLGLVQNHNGAIMDPTLGQCNYVLKFTPSEGSYINYISDDLKSALRITTSNYYSLQTQTVSATSTTEFADLGLAAGNQTISVVSDGTTYTFTLQENNTIGDLLVGLAGYGISGTVNNGTVRIVGTEDAYISGMSADLASLLNLNTANFSTTSTIAATTTILYDNHTQQSRLLHYNEYQTHTITDTFTATVITGTTNVTHTIVATIVEPMTTTSPVTTLVTTTISASEVTFPSITFTVFDAQTYWTEITSSTQITVDSVTTTVNTIDTQLEIQVQTSTLATTLTTVTDAIMTTATRFNQLGISSNQELVVVSNGEEYTITVEAGDTVNDLISTLAGLGITGYVNNGRLTLEGDDDAYIKSITNDLESALKLADDANNYITTGHTTTSNDESNELSTGSANAILNAGMTFGQLGIAEADRLISVVHNGETYTFSMQASDTIGDLFNYLAGVGITASITDGKITLTGDGNSYISSMSENLKNRFNLAGATFSTLQAQELTTDTRLNQLGVNSNQNIVVVNNGIEHTITVEATDSIDDLLTTLAGFGISGSVTGGKLSLEGSATAYVQTIDNDLKTALKLNADDGNYSTVTSNATSSMTFGQLGIAEADRLISVVHNGETHTFSMQASDTIGDMFNYLAGVGITGSITDGVITLTGDGNSYISSMSENLKNRFNLAGATFSTLQAQELTTDTRLNQLGVNADQEVVIVSNGQEYTITVEATDSIDDLLTTLAGFGISGSVTGGKLSLEGSATAYVQTIDNDLKTALKLNADDSNYSTVTSNATSSMTFGQLGIAEADRLISVVHNGETYTFSMQASDTIGDMFNYLAGVGITASITDGVITLTGDGNSYISSMSENLKNRFNLAGATFSTLQAQELTTDTRLNQLGVNSNQNIVVVNNGIEHTITVEATDSIDDLLTTLAGFGISGSVTGGKLSLEGSATAYVQTIDNDLKTALKLNADDGNYSTVTSNATSSMTFGQLGIAEADRLISVVHNGETYTFSMQASDTIGDMFNYLAGVGITGSITDGVITLTGDGNSYISSMSENLKNRFNMSSAVFSTEQAQELTTDTRLNQLGVNSNQNIVVVNNGIEHTITVEATDSIDDLLTTLAGFGISGSVTGGKLSLEGSATAYVQTIDNDLKTALKLNADDGNYSTVTSNATSSMTFGQLGIAEADRLISVVHNGETHTFSMQASDTIGDMFNYLAGVGITGSITDGVITLTGDGNSYISSMSENLKNRFNLAGATFSTTEAQELTTDTRLNQLGVNSNQNIVVVNNGIEHTITVEATDSVDDIISTLAGLGITGSVTDGKLTLQGNENAYIKSIDDGLESALKLSADATNYNAVTGNILSSTTFDSLGIAEADRLISVVHNGETYTFSMQASDTIGDMFNYLAGVGITGSITDGKITLTGDGNSYISSMSENLKNRFNMSSAVFSTEQAQTLTTDTRLNQLGVNSNQNIVVVNNGIEHTITVEATDSVDDIISTLAGLGIAGSVTDGKLTLTGSENAYIKSIDDGLESALKLSADATNYNINTGVQITGNTRFVELGAAATGTISVVSNGNTYTVTVEASDTVDDMLTSLAGLGIYGSIENGVLTLQGDNEAYIQSTANLDYLNLNNNFYTTTEHATYENDASNNQSYETTNVLTTDDTFARHGLTSSDTINIVSNGIETIVTVHADDTIDDFISTLAGLGISSSVHDGKISLQGGANSYISSVGNNIKDVLNLSDSLSFTTITQTITSNTSSDQLESIIRGTATGASELQHLRHEDDSSLSGYDLILQTTSDAGNEFVTLTFSATDSLHDVIDTLAQHGLNAYVDSAGRFGVYSSTLTDFDISGALGEFLMGSYTKIYDQGRVNSVSTNLIQQTVVNMDDSTQLSKLNITSGNLLLYQDGTTYTLTIDNTQNVGDFRNLLAEYGIASEVINGRLQLQADGVVYIDSIAGGSNLAQVMGIEHGGWDMGDYSQESKNLFDKQTITHSATMDDKISELTDGAGNNLGVSAGQIYVYQDGTRNVININTNDTLQDLANKLSQYGISMDISSDGKIYFNGNNNSYLTTDGIASGSASNILTKFNVSNNWETRYNSTSETLDYEQQDDVMVDGNTKLVDLKDNSGNSLGITEGNYYVYQNGVRNTESISSDTTVNDFLSTMALYGISTDFDQNGSLSLGGYNETYLATAATGGDNTNAIDVLFESWNFVNIYTTNNLDIPTSVTAAITESTKLSNINEGAYQAGYITVVKDGVQTDIELTADDTVGNLMDELALYGFESVINGNGQLIIKNTGDSLLQTYNGAGTASNALQLLGIDLNNWVTTNSYESGTINVVSTTTETISADRSTLLSEMGVSAGEYYVWNNGVKYTAFISSDETLGSFIDTLRGFGLETSFVDTGAGSRLSLEGSGDAYIASSNSTDNKSNVVEVLFTNPVSQNYIYQGVQETSRLVTTYSNATEDTLLSHYDSGLLLAEGNLSVNIDGVDTVIQVEADDTIGSLLNKFRALGMEASLADGHIIIQSGYKDMTINVDGTTSNLLATLNMTFRNDLGGYISSADEIEQTVAEEKVISVSNYADFNTQMKLLNISDGTLSVYRNGEKATINIDSEQTFGALSFSLLDRFGDVNIRIDENTGYLEFYSTDPNVSVEVGSTTDTSNFSAITGVSSSGNGTARSARELYCVNSSSVITTAGIFRNGNVVEGTFFIGDEEFTIDDTTTLSSLISQINVSERANATAYWDSVDGKFVIKSRTTGAALVNIEAGTSNFTDIMGFTKSEWADADSDGTPDIGESTATVTRMNIDAQEVGDNARFSINGTYYTSTSNTISSDVSRIQGLTINLKGISEGETTLTVERDKETVANAVSDIVDAYNELIENVDKEVAKGSPLDDQSTLKFLRNQIRSLMTSSLYGTGVFKNLDAIGISLDAATSGNIRTDNINVLTFDKNKFLDAFDADRESLKSLLVGTDANLGIFQRVESVIETAISANSGFFTSAEMSYNKQISNLDNKIEKAKKAVERYRERLEAKFASMDLLISNMQNQYSSFLGF